MKPIYLRQTPSIGVEFTMSDVRILCLCAKHHYDGRCKDSFKSTMGLIHRIKRMYIVYHFHQMGPFRFVLNHGELDHLTKVLEYGGMMWSGRPYQRYEWRVWNELNRQMHHTIQFLRNFYKEQDIYVEKTEDARSCTSKEKWTLG